MSVPSQIGQYRILRKLGAGGMGMVFVGEHRLIHRRAAIKTLQPALSRQPEIVDRFFNEARAMSAVSDPGFVQIFDFGYHVDGTAYIVMELLEGEGLADRLDRLGTLAIPSALRIARQMASSLAAAHDQQIVHRDLKPENIFLVRDREAQGGERTKILDFGICAVGGAPETNAPPGTVIGTPIYMAPEQCRGRVDGDPRSDIYGLGCVLFHMLTGQPPFERDSVREIIEAHIDEPPPPLGSLREDVPPLVEELVQRCLAKAPEDRFASMTELGAELERVLARLSAPELPELPEPAEAPAEVRLGAGYRSAYDASIAALGDWDDRATEAAPVVAVAAPAARVARPAAAVAPATATATELVAGASLRRAALRKAAIGLALLGGALVASLATRLADGDGALARANVPAPAVVAPVAPRPAPAPAAAPAAPAVAATPVSAPAAAARGSEPEIAAAPRAADASGAPARSARRDRASRKASAPAAVIAESQRPPTSAPAPVAPAPRPPTASAAAPAQATSEDLYDTR